MENKQNEEIKANSTFSKEAIDEINYTAEYASSKKTASERCNFLSGGLRKIAETLDKDTEDFYKTIIAAFKADIDGLKSAEEDGQYQQESINMTINHYLVKTAYVALRCPQLRDNSSVNKIVKFLAEAYEGYGYPGTAKDFYSFLNSQSFAEKIIELDELIKTYGAINKIPGQQKTKSVQNVNMLLESLKEESIMDVDVLGYVKDLKGRVN